LNGLRVAWQFLVAIQYGFADLTPFVYGPCFLGGVFVYGYGNFFLWGMETGVSGMNRSSSKYQL